MEKVKQKIYHKDGLRLLFRDIGDFTCCVDAIILEQKLRIVRVGNNRWNQDCKDYPYFIVIGHIEDEGYLYLDKLFKSLNLTSGHESNESVKSL